MESQGHPLHVVHVMNKLYLVPMFAGSNPAEAVGFLRGKKSLARIPLRHVKDP
jgi:hypothetical protein